MHFTFQDGTNVVLLGCSLGGFGAPRASRVSLTGSFVQMAQSAAHEWTIDFFSFSFSQTLLKDRGEDVQLARVRRWGM